MFVDALCSDGSECPSHLPYCTPAGCSFTCPDNTRINGTNCVLDCGNFYIFNKECVMKCPKTHAFVRRNITVRQSAFVRLQFCLEKCPEQTFNFDQQCLDACPSSDDYVYNNTCVKECPKSHMFHSNITRDGIVIGFECLSECSGSNPVRYRNICLTSCTPPLYVYQHKCVDKCPDNATKVFQSNYFGSRANFCDDACPHGLYSINHTCVGACPSNYSVFNNSVCVNVCPEESPYSYFNTIFHSKNSCVADCHPNYIHKNMCVSQCPKDTVLVNNTSCENSCPSTAPVICDERTERYCRNDVWLLAAYPPVKYMQKCMPSCPENTYIDNNYCVSNCVGNKKLFEKTCVKICPADYPYELNVTINQAYPYMHTRILKCVESCPKRTFLSDKMCVQECPDGQYLFENNNTCINECPLQSYLKKGKSCLDRCPEQLFNQSGNCVDDCPSKLAFNKTCVTECPTTSLLIQEANRWPRILTHTCVGQCSEHRFEYNGTCVQQCDQMIGPNNTCVSECPKSHPYKKSQGEKTCVSKCGNNQLVLDGTCINRYNCERKFQFNNHCLTECPTSHPYTLDSIPVSCTDRCDNNHVLLNNTCISDYNCKLAVIFNGTCLDQCPQGYYWINYRTGANAYDLVCVRKELMWIFLMIFVVLCVVLAICWWYCTASEHRRSVICKCLRCKTDMLKVSNSIDSKGGTHF